jgi:2,5-diamino-6-(ribosylamino)-4(3H)-pyrimidinone 5'-phosphate reductase
MVEGGGVVINDLLAPENLPLIGSVIITIAPIYLGQHGAGVEPGTSMGDDGRDLPAVEFKDVEWCILGRDVVMVARPITHNQL